MEIDLNKCQIFIALYVWYGAARMEIFENKADFEKEVPKIKDMIGVSEYLFIKNSADLYHAYLDCADFAIKQKLKDLLIDRFGFKPKVK